MRTDFQQTSPEYRIAHPSSMSLVSSHHTLLGRSVAQDFFLSFFAQCIITWPLELNATQRGSITADSRASASAFASYKFNLPSHVTMRARHAHEDRTVSCSAGGAGPPCNATRRTYCRLYSITKKNEKKNRTFWIAPLNRHNTTHTYKYSASRSLTGAAEILMATTWWTHGENNHHRPTNKWSAPSEQHKKTHMHVWIKTC